VEKLSKIAQEPEGFLKEKMAKKGRNEWKTKQPRLLQFRFFNLFFFPPKKLEARA